MATSPKDPRAVCSVCGRPTEHVATKRCDLCWEIEHKLPEYLRTPNGRAITRRLIADAEEDHDERRTKASPERKAE